jgi:hypothetical protein
MSTSLYSLEPSKEEVLLWKAIPRPAESANMYNMTRFAMRLNELTPNLRDWIAPTDSRNRPDQRAMENGDLQQGIILKDKLEQKQRQARKEREKQQRLLRKKGSVSLNQERMDQERDDPNDPDEEPSEYSDEQEPAWFRYDPSEKDTGEPQWVYKGGYWEARHLHQWSSAPNIYL